MDDEPTIVSDEAMNDPTVADAVRDDRPPVVVADPASPPGGSRGKWLIGLVALAALVVLGFVWLSGGFDSDKVSTDAGPKASTGPSGQPGVEPGPGGSIPAPGSDVSGPAPAPGATPTPAVPADAPVPRVGAVPTPDEICNLVPAPDLRSAAGVELLPISGSGGRCVYNVKDDPTQAVTVEKYAVADAAGTFATQKSRFGPSQVKALSGAGDEAFVAAGQAFVRKRTTIVNIVVALKRPVAQLDDVASKLALAAAKAI